MLRTILMAIGAMTAVSLAAIGTKDTVATDPVRPTPRDPVTFYLFNYDICCCASYTEQAVTSDDTAITLSYTVDERPCMACLCLMAGSTVSFIGGPYKAGTYSVYKVEDPCAPGMICPLMLPLPELVGKVTISAATDAVVRAPAVPVNRVQSMAFAVDIRGRVVADARGNGIRISGNASRGQLRVKTTDFLSH